jgi:flagellar basal-body rod protein FlgG
MYLMDKDARIPIGGLGFGAGVREVGFNLDMGSLTDTGNKTDMTINGEGFFVLQTPQGIAYTKDGHFSVDTQGRLVNSQGNLVLGQNGAINVGTDDFDVDKDGNIFVNGQNVDRLQVYFPSQPQALRKVGDNMFTGGGPNGGGQVYVMQGKLEGSNVNPAKEMVEMIAAMRAYETSQRAIQAQDELLGKAVNEVGRVA